MTPAEVFGVRSIRAEGVRDLLVSLMGLAELRPLFSLPLPRSVDSSTDDEPNFSGDRFLAIRFGVAPTYFLSGESSPGSDISICLLPEATASAAAPCIFALTVASLIGD